MSHSKNVNLNLDDLSKNLDDLSKDWDNLLNPTGIFPLPLEDVVKHFVWGALKKKGMDQAHEVLDMIGDCLE